MRLFLFILLFIPTIVIATENQTLKIHTYKESEVIEAPHIGDMFFYVKIDKKITLLDKEREIKLQELNKKLQENNNKADFFSITPITIAIPANNILFLDIKAKPVFVRRDKSSYPIMKTTTTHQYEEAIQFFEKTTKKIYDEYKVFLIVYPLDQEPLDNHEVIVFATMIPPYFKEVAALFQKDSFDFFPTTLLSKENYKLISNLPFVYAYPQPVFPVFE